MKIHFSFSGNACVYQHAIGSGTARSNVFGSFGFNPLEAVDGTWIAWARPLSQSCCGARAARMCFCSTLTLLMRPQKSFGISSSNDTILPHTFLLLLALVTGLLVQHQRWRIKNCVQPNSIACCLFIHLSLVFGVFVCVFIVVYRPAGQREQQFAPTIRLLSFCSQLFSGLFPQVP